MQNIIKLFDEIKTVGEARKLYPMTNNCIYLDSAHYSPYSLETKRRLNGFIQKNLEEKKIFIALREGFLRVSPHLFNNKEDIFELLSAIKEIKK